MSQYEPWSHRQFRVEPPKWTVSHYESAARRMKSSSLGCTAVCGHSQGSAYRRGCSDLSVLARDVSRLQLQEITKHQQAFANSMKKNETSRINK